MSAFVKFAVYWDEAKGRIKSFLGAGTGATAMEYALLASGIAIGIVVAVASLGGAVQGTFEDIGAAITF